MIPTSDRRVGGQQSTLVVSTLYGNYSAQVIGERGEFISRYPLIPITPSRFAKRAKELYMIGMYPSKYDGKNFVSLNIMPIPYNIESGVVVENTLVIVGVGHITGYDLYTGEQKFIYRDYSFITHFDPQPDGSIVGTSFYLVVKLDQNFNVQNMIPIKGRVAMHVAYDGNYYYVTEDMMYVRKYDQNGNLLAERFLYYAQWIIFYQDKLYVSYIDGVAVLDKNLNVVDKIVSPFTPVFAILGGYIYGMHAGGVITKIDITTKQVVKFYNFNYEFMVLRSTDDGRLIASVKDSKGNVYIKLYDQDMTEVATYSKADVLFLDQAIDPCKIAGKRWIVTSTNYGFDLVFDMDTKQIITFIANFFPHDIDFDGRFYAVANTMLGLVMIFDKNLNLVNFVQLNAPMSLYYHNGMLYVADYGANAVYVLDDSFKIVKTISMSKIFDKYPINIIGRWSKGWYGLDLYSKLVLFDDNFNPIKIIYLSSLNDIISDFAEYQGKWYLLGAKTSVLYQIDQDGKVLARYLAGFEFIDKATPSYTGGLIIVSPIKKTRFFKDLGFEKIIDFYTRAYYKTYKNTFIASTFGVYAGMQLSVVAEFDVDGNLLRYVILPNTSAFHAVLLIDDSIVIADHNDLSVKKYRWDGSLVWKISFNNMPFIAPRNDFKGVWLYGYEYVKSIDLNGNVSDFIVEEKTMFNGVYEDDYHVYALELDPKPRVRKYDKNGRYLSDIYYVPNVRGPVWLLGDVSDVSTPYHVFR